MPRRLNQELATMTAPDGLLLTSDLMFTSKVTGTAAALGFHVEVIETIERLVARANESPVKAVFLDLGCPCLGDLPTGIASIMSGLPAENRPFVMAYGSHVDTASLEAARAAGCNEVLPRSRFSSALPELLTNVLG